MKIIDDDTLAAILSDLSQGVDLTTAVVGAGYNLNAFLRILEKGQAAYVREGDTGRKVRVAEAEAYTVYVETFKARAQAARALVKSIREAEDWKAQRWLLETQHGETHAGQESAHTLTTAPTTMRGGELDY